MSQISVVLVDGHTLVREGLKHLLNTQDDLLVVGEAADATEGARLIAELKPRLAIVDVIARAQRGVTTVTRLRASCPTARMLAMACRDDSDLVRSVMEAGANGYLLKRSSPGELLLAIRTVAKGITYFDKSLTGSTGGSMRSPAFGAAIGAGDGPFARSGGSVGLLGEPSAALSSRELEVLRMLAAGHTNKEIADNLDLSVKTIETYKARLMQKLHIHSRVDIVRYAFRRGLLENL